MAHKEVLNLLDTAFIPQATDAALRADLIIARGQVATHLEEAKRIRVALGSLGSDGGIDGSIDTGVLDAGGDR